MQTPQSNQGIFLVCDPYVIHPAEIYFDGMVTSILPEVYSRYVLLEMNLYTFFCIMACWVFLAVHLLQKGFVESVPSDAEGLMVSFKKLQGMVEQVHEYVKNVAVSAALSVSGHWPIW